MSDYGWKKMKRESLLESLRSIRFDMEERRRVIDELSEALEDLYSQMKKLNPKNPVERSKRDRIYGDIQYAKAKRDEMYRLLDGDREAISRIKEELDSL